MRNLLPLLCVLCATPVHSIFDGTCLKKDPPPGALVLSPGSKLVLTCSGHVTVDGVKVRNSSNTKRRGSPSGATPTAVNVVNNPGVPVDSDKPAMQNALSDGYRSNPTEARDNRGLRHTDTGHTASPSAHVVQPTSVQRLLKGGEMDGEADYEEEEEEGEEGSRVTRGIKWKTQWRWSGKTVGKGDQGEISFERTGATLSLSSVRLADSGKYMCYHRGRERFSLKVIVADPPESPSLSCYKKSPSSKIRCEWTPQKPVTIQPKCYLLLSKSSTQAFLRLQCSYSSRASRCWCALDHDEDELRTVHLAYLCVTSIAGNATSPLVDFTPLRILKPDPPSNVSVRPVERQATRMKVTWSLPTSWKSQDNYYELIYEIKYKPLRSSFYHEQIHKIKGQRSHTITDAMPGVEYLIQLRTKEEYDGVWSDWSTPVCAIGGADQNGDLTTTLFPVYIDTEGSGPDGSVTDVPSVAAVPTDSAVVSPHVLWISALFVLLSVILAAYIFRHKDRFMSKLQSLSVVTQCGGSPQPPPSAPTAPEGQALVTFGPPIYNEPPPSEVEEWGEENEEHCRNERIEAMHFNNTSYFFLQQY
ncbi:interleukin-6 receptor subunit alpha isoform X2 [Chelmon rostratus]|uniref:interleukin-6 receptor subunit alpha isoform X2 n=1 Tax=Chelmon rostratus TaxID=109905 RepID=UPI001BE7B46A|nr:interleukin-6 receptor subunit alpha isoform X2 [Chelmon rostratus]